MPAACLSLFNQDPYCLPETQSQQPTKKYWCNPNDPANVPGLMELLCHCLSYPGWFHCLAWPVKTFCWPAAQIILVAGGPTNREEPLIRGFTASFSASGMHPWQISQLRPATLQNITILVRKEIRSAQNRFRFDLSPELQESLIVASMASRQKTATAVFPVCLWRTNQPVPTIGARPKMPRSIPKIQCSVSTPPPSYVAAPTSSR